MARAPRIMTQAAQAYSFSRRAWLLGAAQAGVGGLLIGRMGWLAIAENEHYNLLSESNRVSMTMIPPRRGWIVDRHGQPIANNRADFRVDVIPDRLEDKDRTLALLRQILALTDEDMARIEADLKKAVGFRPVEIKENIDWDRFAAVQVRQPEMPGVAPTRGFARQYPAGAAVAHLTGYVGAASAEQYKATRDPLYNTPGFKLGKDGLEKTMEPLLRGKAGAKRVEVTARGKLVQELATRPDVPGRTLRLTIDAGLQEYAARRLGTNSGSAVVFDCQTGEMLAMVSMPAYDPNSFSSGISQSEWKMLSEDDHVPLMNKVTQGLYPPGSTVKPMNGLALLAAGVSPDERVFCSGAMRVGTGVFHCHKRGGHGPLDLKNAIMQSCDIYFYEMVRRVGYDRIAPVARALGLGQKFDLPLVTQRYGTVPDSAWKQRKYKTDWKVADSLNASIGQGDTAVTPLQMAMVYAAIANGGTVYEPQLVKAIVSADGREIQEIPPIVSNEITGSRTRQSIRFLQRTLPGVTTDGSGRDPFSGFPLDQIPVASKTGSAQVTGDKVSTSWFASYAPADDPQYAVVMMVTQGGLGSKTSAPSVRKIYEALFGVDGQDVNPRRSVLVDGKPSSNLPVIRNDGTPVLPLGKDSGLPEARETLTARGDEGGG